MAVLTPFWSIDAILIFLSVLVTAYFYMTRNFNYWIKRGVTEASPLPFVGNLLDCCLFRISPSKCFATLYEQGKGLPYVGFYVFDKPALLLRDPYIIKSILVKNFNHFPERYVSTDESNIISASNLLLVKTPRWKSLRQKISPIFTSSKMRKMFQLMLVVGKELETYLDTRDLQGNGRVIEVKEINARYTTDLITSCAFGLQVNSLNDPDSLFRKCGEEIFGVSNLKRCAEFAGCFFIPAAVKLLKLDLFPKKTSNFLRQVFSKTMAERIENNIQRHDLIDLLIDLKKSHNHDYDPDTFQFNEDGLIGQAATFFAAGFETSSTTMSFTLYELALNPDVQSKLRQEIVSALKETGGEITYEMVMNLPYLDMVVSETLRKFPSLPILDRLAINDYKVPGTDLVIEKGIPVYVSLFGLHNDPEYFPEPEKYDPERFSNENKEKRPPCVYLPFGEGPRNCIGLRFGLLSSKLGVMTFILNYKVTACKETMIPIRLEQKVILVTAESGIYLKVRRITADA